MITKNMFEYILKTGKPRMTPRFLAKTTGRMKLPFTERRDWED